MDNQAPLPVPPMTEIAVKLQVFSRQGGKFIPLEWDEDGAGLALALGPDAQAALENIGTQLDDVVTELTLIAADVEDIKVAAQTIATEQTAIRKQGQGRMITAGAFATGAGTIVTLAANYNKIKIFVCNRDTAVADMEVQHTPTGGTPVGYLEDNPTFPASTTLAYDLPGALSGDKLVFIGPTTMKYLIYGSTE